MASKHTKPAQQIVAMRGRSYMHVYMIKSNLDLSQRLYRSHAQTSTCMYISMFLATCYVQNKRDLINM